ncbi:Derlin-2.2 [Camellia lanceoleosa]|uniref:Derlin-2.2 n=1 Tax=Camellia lanceoleosa TaxID=1840588 RepID=A0ACC0I498_9ERIC|nr:Derlin-2.2 [Camellia lanceoleosa]
MAQAVEEWYKQMPIITCSYLTVAIVITVGCSLDIRDFHIAEKEEDIGYYACYVAAATFVLYVIKFPEPFSMTRHMHVKFSTRNTKL